MDSLKDSPTSHAVVSARQHSSPGAVGKGLLTPQTLLCPDPKPGLELPALHQIQMSLCHHSPIIGSRVLGYPILETYSKYEMIELWKKTQAVLTSCGGTRKAMCSVFYLGQSHSWKQEFVNKIILIHSGTQGSMPPLSASWGCDLATCFFFHMCGNNTGFSGGVTG